MLIHTKKKKGMTKGNSFFEDSLLFQKGEGGHGSSRIPGDSPGRKGNSLLGGLRKKGRGEGNAEPSLYTQSEKDTIEEYTRNFWSLWDTVEAFGGSPWIHQGLVDAELKRRGLTDPDNNQLEAAQNVAGEQKRPC
jgi:hypothetical protein